MTESASSLLDSTTVFEHLDKSIVVIDGENTIENVAQVCDAELQVSKNSVGDDITSQVPYGEELVTALVGGDTSGIKTVRRFDITESVFEDDEYAVIKNTHGVELLVKCEESVKLFNVQAELIEHEEYKEHTVFFFEDVTNRLNIEKQLKMLLTVGNDIVGVVTSQTEIQQLNTLDVGKVGSNYELGVDNIYKVIHEKDKQKVKTAIESVSDTGKSSVVRCRLQVGEDNWKMFELSVHESHSIPIVDGMLMVGIDVTDQYFFQQRRQVMNRVLRHDLRNDMNVVLGHAGILAELVDEDSQEHVEQIQMKADSLVTLGEKVRKIDRQLHGVNRNLKQVNLSRMVREEVEEFHKQYPSVKVRTQIGDVFVVGNGLIRTAISNALENAVEHNDKDTPEIEVELETEYEKEEGKVVLEIRDNGPGIPEGERQVITDGVETPLAHISGLGLWMIKWITNGVGGELIIDSNTPDGTIVRFEFSAASITPSNEDGKADVLGPGGLNIKDEMQFGADDEPIGTSTRE